MKSDSPEFTPAFPFRLTSQIRPITIMIAILALAISHQASAIGLPKPVKAITHAASTVVKGAVKIPIKVTKAAAKTAKVPVTGTVKTIQVVTGHKSPARAAKEMKRNVVSSVKATGEALEISGRTARDVRDSLIAVPGSTGRIAGGKTGAKVLEAAAHAKRPHDEAAISSAIAAGSLMQGKNPFSELTPTLAVAGGLSGRH